MTEPHPQPTATGAPGPGSSSPQQDGAVPDDLAPTKQHGDALADAVGSGGAQPGGTSADTGEQADPA
jgi:hypothetical protein